MEQPKPQPAPLWDASNTGRGLACFVMVPAIGIPSPLRLKKIPWCVPATQMWGNAWVVSPQAVVHGAATYIAMQVSESLLSRSPACGPGSGTVGSHDDAVLNCCGRVAVPHHIPTSNRPKFRCSLPSPVPIIARGELYEMHLPGHFQGSRIIPAGVVPAWLNSLSSDDPLFPLMTSSPSPEPPHSIRPHKSLEGVWAFQPWSPKTQATHLYLEPAPLRMLKLDRFTLSRVPQFVCVLWS